MLAKSYKPAVREFDWRYQIKRVGSAQSKCTICSWRAQLADIAETMTPKGVAGFRLCIVPISNSTDKQEKKSGSL